jgi:hypothetical protein
MSSAIFVYFLINTTRIFVERRAASPDENWLFDSKEMSSSIKLMRKQSNLDWFFTDFGK